MSSSRESPQAEPEYAYYYYDEEIDFRFGGARGAFRFNTHDSLRIYDKASGPRKWA
jgi:hypothetical protein